MIIQPWYFNVFYFTPFTPRCLHKSMFSSFCSILSNSFQQTEVHERLGGCFSNKCPELKLQGVVCVQPPASNSGKFASILGVPHTQGILGGSSQDLYVVNNHGLISPQDPGPIRFPNGLEMAFSYGL